MIFLSYFCIIYLEKKSITEAICVVIIIYAIFIKEDIIMNGNYLISNPAFDFFNHPHINIFGINLFNVAIIFFISNLLAHRVPSVETMVAAVGFIFFNGDLTSVSLSVKAR